MRRPPMSTDLSGRTYRFDGALGDTERGMALLERGVNERSPVAIVLDVDMMLDTLRPDPRYERLAARVRANRDDAARASTGATR